MEKERKMSRRCAKMGKDVVIENPVVGYRSMTTSVQTSDAAARRFYEAWCHQLGR